MLDFIYNHSPIFFQNIMVSFKGKQFIKQRYTKHYYEELQILRNNKNKYMLQEKRLNDFIVYLKNNSKYYEKLLTNIDLPVTMQGLKSIPILEKQTINQNISNIVTTDKNLIKMQTGGSTGVGLNFYSTPYDMSRKFAYLDYFKETHGVFKGMRRASIGGRALIPNFQKRKIYWRYNKPLNQMLFSAYHADGENLQYYIEQLNKFKPETIDGFTTVIHRLAKYINDNKIELNFLPIAIFPTAEALTDDMKHDIECAFKCPVRNQYASSEGAPFITENVNGELEINPETGVFELQHIQDNIYELIVTGFYTTTTPLLRYRIGDSVELYEKLPSNYAQRDIKIKRIIGRNNDFLLSNERGIVTNVNLSTVIREAGDHIKSSQFVQNKLEVIDIYLVTEDKVNKEKLEKLLVSKLNIRFGNSTTFKFHYVEEIEKTSGGKTRFTINNID
ncbi:phenylacetate--CoA ligase family protein [Mammaliicoccus sciuri]|uniref:phenylacetate--CoA ligase family protein n=1 Tax=Mammaliicoccus sciuri TaxID=1296 RepID=UPI0009C3D040|nr:phenylacetate--CoA ligase family protein [Mammaliicoccus sciuri]ARB41495.1 capsule biosynthesis protein CapK [Mammaliicoccus sciuri]RIN86436.1 phenylacetate--CoA ligase family protein [Mammaliicoccus sciuri]